MKKLFATLLTVGTLFFAASAQATAPQTQEEFNATANPPASMIDGIEVPYNVLEYAQMKYQGHAVTQVQRVYRGSEQVYRLRVDRDDIPDDFNSIMLFYNLKWKLIGDEKMIAPQVPRYVAPKPQEDQQKARPKPQDRDQEDRSQPGGRGGGESEDPQPAEPEEPTDPEEPIDEDEELPSVHMPRNRR